MTLKFLHQIFEFKKFIKIVNRNIYLLSTNNILSPGGISHENVSWKYVIKLIFIQTRRTKFNTKKKSWWILSVVNWNFPKFKQEQKHGLVEQQKLRVWQMCHIYIGWANFPSSHSITDTFAITCIYFMKNSTQSAKRQYINFCAA